MNSLHSVGRQFAYSQNTFAAPARHPYSQATFIAMRCFSQKSDQNPPSKPLYPLHDAASRGDVERVRQLLKTDIDEVNGLNAEGESPLGIAAKKYLRRKNYPSEILELLHNYGACYQLKDGKGKAAREYVVKKENASLAVKIDSTRHSRDGCGLQMSRCVHICPDECKKYSAELKAKIALESLSSQLTIEELARKHCVRPGEVIKWRWQAREGLVSVFNKPLIQGSGATRKNR